MKLLGYDNAKTSKGEKLNVLTGILYLAPAKISGYQVCPKRTEGCTAACLYTAGMGGFSNVQQARINKTKMFFEKRDEFLNQLRKELKSHIKKAQKLNMIPAVRLNGTSDINWNRFGIMDEFPEIQFYDYTKVYKRLTSNNLSNYHLTFSKSEDNGIECIKALKEGYNVAMVFDIKKGKDLPKTYQGFTVIDGDESDTRFLDKKSCIIGLRAKGDAKKDKSGFVIKI